MQSPPPHSLAHAIFRMWMLWIVLFLWILLLSVKCKLAADAHTDSKLQKNNKMHIQNVSPVGGDTLLLASLLASTLSLQLITLCAGEKLFASAYDF